MFACSGRPRWVTVKDGIADGEAVPAWHADASPCGRSCSVPTGRPRAAGWGAELALMSV